MCIKASAPAGNRSSCLCDASALRPFFCDLKFMKHSRIRAPDTLPPVNSKGKVTPQQRLSDGSVPLAHLARFRQEAYQFFSALLSYPEVELFKAALEAALRLGFEVKRNSNFAFFDRWQPLVAALADVAAKDLHKIQQEYSEIFVAGPGIMPCHPLESVYVDQQEHAAAWTIAQLEKEYASAGLIFSPDIHVMSDHATVELEFMSFLCSQEAETWDRKRVKDGIEMLERQAAFLDRHLARWIPNWARRVALARGEGFYSVTAETAHAFISHDQDLIKTLIPRLMTIPEMPRSEAVDTERKQ
jgi:TorA maturation chaperone TorD